MTEDQAKSRFMVLSLVRLFALAMVLAGVANIAGAFIASLTPTLGYVLLVLGAADFFLAPAILKKHWQNQDR
jgi:hypothetical protein